MRAVIQRVSSASVTIEGAVKAAIGPGLIILLGVGHEDGPEDIEWLVKKIAGLRIFDDEAGVMNRDKKEPCARNARMAPRVLCGWKGLQTDGDMM